MIKFDMFAFESSRDFSINAYIGNHPLCGMRSQSVECNYCAEPGRSLTPRLDFECIPHVTSSQI